VVALTMAVLLAVAVIGRDGYSPDEEITLFAVRGIETHGLPVLPSGALYLRGLLYSYAAWLAGAIAGHDLIVYRSLSLLCALGAIVCVWRLARIVSTPLAAAVAAIMFAVAPASVSVSVSARFYAPAMAAVAWSLLVAVRGLDRAPPRRPFLAAAIVARAFHEFALSLASVPMTALITESRGRRMVTARWALVCLAVLGGQHVLLIWLQRAASHTTDPMFGFTRLGLPRLTQAAHPAIALAQSSDAAVMLLAMTLAAVAVRRATQADRVFVMAAAAAATALAPGVIAALAVAWTMLWPARMARTLVAGLAMALAGWLAWTLLVLGRADAALTWPLARGLLTTGLLYPWEGPRFLLVELPVLSLLAAGGLVAVIALESGVPASRRSVQVLGLVLWLQILAIGVFNVDLKARFVALLLPLLAVFGGSGIAVIAWNGWAGWGGWHRWAVARGGARGGIVAVALVAIVFEQARLIERQRDRPRQAGWLAPWSPPTALPSLDSSTRPSVAADDIVITNDELACLLLVGRVDYWWAPDATSAERYSMRSGGGRRGNYGGGAVLVGSGAVREVLEGADNRAVAVVLFDSGKFGFDPAGLQSIKPSGSSMDVRERPGEWVMARVVR
jgi:hypothetical protein